jgi:hypothetical protein
VKRQKTQPKNPHQLPVQQHIFPAASIQRFADKSGLVTVTLLPSKRQFKVLPKAEIFCAYRAWDKRAETGYMKEIEDDFQGLVDEIIRGVRTLNSQQCGICSKFFALWHFRFQERHAPTSAAHIKGILGENLSKDSEELLESNNISFFRTDQTVPGHIVAGLKIQTSILQAGTLLRHLPWGIWTATQGELILPDTFGKITIIPISPDTSLVQGQTDRNISIAEVARLNRLAIQSAKQYCAARDFSLCPT